MSGIVLKSYIMMLCLSDYFLTIIGLRIGYVEELNPIFNYFFGQNKYTLGLAFKILITLMGLQVLENNKETMPHNISYKIILYYILCIYLSINGLHTYYAILEMIARC